jgi:hypothetical protein
MAEQQFIELPAQLQVGVSIGINKPDLYLEFVNFSKERTIGLWSKKNT